MGAAVLRGLGLLLAAVLAMWPALSVAHAGAPTVIPVGKAVGIKLFSDGVVVVGTSDIATDGGSVNPAKACGCGRATSSPTSTPPRWTPLRRCPPCSRSWRGRP